MSINEELEQLYSKYFEEAKKAYIAKKLQGNFKIANPLLLKISEREYEASDLKVMIYGQETYGWFDKTTAPKDIETLKNSQWEFVSEYETAETTQEFGSVSLKQLMYEYDKYLNHDIRKKKKSTFWNNGFYYFSKGLSEGYKKPYFMWNNLSKFGKINETGMTNEIGTFEKEYFPVVSKELEILKPDIVIFLTGPSRDGDIKKQFNNVTFKSIDTKEPIVSKNRKTRYSAPELVLFPQLSHIKAIRLYHPNYFGGYNKVKELALNTLIENQPIQ